MGGRHTGGSTACAAGSRVDLRLVLLGGFSVEIGPERVTLPISAQRLLAYLALGGPVARAAAAGALWPETGECKALASLRTAMWRANRCVPEMVRATQSVVGLAAQVRVDVDELVGEADLVLKGDRAQGRNGPIAPLQPPELLRRRADAELLPGWYEDWVIFERERLRHLRLHAMEASAAQLVQAGRVALALDVALEVVRCEPLRESAHRVVVSAHLAEGNISEAIQAFENYRSILGKELGLGPSQQLRDLITAWLDGQRSAPRQGRVMRT